jgi:hypothetical protein
MTDTHTSTMDVFSASRWFASLPNSKARATGPDTLEWQCRTWGSGRGGGVWADTFMFIIAAERFKLRTWRDDEARDTLVVEVPMGLLVEIFGLIERLGEDPESLPWCFADEREEQVAIAAEVLKLRPEELEDDYEFLELLRID